MKTRDLAATCQLYRLVLLQGGRHVASQRPTFTARENCLSGPLFGESWLCNEL